MLFCVLQVQGELPGAPAEHSLPEGGGEGPGVGAGAEPTEGVWAAPVHREDDVQEHNPALRELIPQLQGKSMCFIVVANTSLKVICLRGFGFQ